MWILAYSLLVWLSVFMLVKWLDVRSKGLISRYLHSRKVVLYLGYVSWSTERFSSALARASVKYRRWWDVWFSLGVAAGLVGLFFSVVILGTNLALTLGHTLSGGAAALPAVAHLNGISSGARSLSPAAAVLPLQNLGQRSPLAYATAAEDGAKPGDNVQVRAAEVKLEGDDELGDYDEVFEGHVRHAEEMVREAYSTLGKSTGIITPLLPGVNLPPSQLSYILLALLASAVFHELGHALAAGAEDLSVRSVGGFLALIFPGAFVQIDDVGKLSTWRQLKVYCAGAWHNIVLSVICVALIYALPTLILPLYTADQGLTVTAMPPHSKLLTHVSSGDVIRAVNSINVRSRADFVHALVEIKSSRNSSRSSFGFCLEEPDIQRIQMAAGTDCCVGGGERSRDSCFVSDGGRRLCLHGGIASPERSCVNTAECLNAAESVNTPPSQCMFAMLPGEQQLLDLWICDSRTLEDRHVIFQGRPETLEASMIVSNYAPRLAFLSTALPWLYEGVVSLDVPRRLDRLLQFTFSVSLCLAVLNMAPVFFLDGEASVILFARIFRPRMSEHAELRLKKMLLWGGTLLMAGNLIFSLAALRY